jgi:hypothetical protein
MAFKEGKLQLAKALCDWCLAASSLEEKLLQTVVGFFAWISRPLPILRPFLAEAQCLLKKLSRERRTIRPSARLRQGVSVAKDILLGLLPDHRFVLHKGHEANAVPDAVIRSDASGDLGKGAGATLILPQSGNRVLVAAFSRLWSQEEHQAAMREESSSSTQLELLAVLKCLEFFRLKFPTKIGSILIEVELDSKAAVHIIQAGYSRVHAVNEVVKQIFLFLARHNLDLRVRHVLRDENSTADALSKQDFQVGHRLLSVTLILTELLLALLQRSLSLSQRSSRSSSEFPNGSVVVA